MSCCYHSIPPLDYLSIRLCHISEYRKPVFFKYIQTALCPILSKANLCAVFPRPPAPELSCPFAKRLKPGRILPSRLRPPPSVRDSPHKSPADSFLRTALKANPVKNVIDILTHSARYLPKPSGPCQGLFLSGYSSRQRNLCHSVSPTCSESACVTEQLNLFCCQGTLAFGLS